VARQRPARVPVGDDRRFPHDPAGPVGVEDPGPDIPLGPISKLASRPNTVTATGAGPFPPVHSVRTVRGGGSGGWNCRSSVSGGSIASGRRPSAGGLGARTLRCGPASTAVRSRRAAARRSDAGARASLPRILERPCSQWDRPEFLCAEGTSAVGDLPASTPTPTSTSMGTAKTPMRVWGWPGRASPVSVCTGRSPGTPFIKDLSPATRKTRLGSPVWRRGRHRRRERRDQTVAPGADLDTFQQLISRRPYDGWY
jgi:hypothetical protein